MLAKGKWKGNAKLDDELQENTTSASTGPASGHEADFDSVTRVMPTIYDMNDSRQQGDDDYDNDNENEGVMSGVGVGGCELLQDTTKGESKRYQTSAWAGPASGPEDDDNDMNDSRQQGNDDYENEYHDHEFLCVCVCVFAPGRRPA
jgi:hypothetical protein